MHALGGELLVGRRQVRAADRRGTLLDQRLDHEEQPVGIGEGVVIDVGDDFARGELHAGVAGVAEASVRLDAVVVDRITRGDLVDRLGRTVVDDQHLVVRVIQPAERFEAGGQRPRTVVGRDDDSNPRPLALAHLVMIQPVGLADHLEGGLGMAFGIGDAECPALDRLVEDAPFVGPAVDRGAAQAFLEGRPEILVKECRLCVAAVLGAVEAEFGEEQRALARQAVQARKVRPERPLVLEIDVIRDDVEVRQVEIFGRRVVDISDQAAVGVLLDDVAKPPEELADPLDTVPADDQRRHLVADRIHQDGRVASEFAGAVFRPLVEEVLAVGAAQKRGPQPTSGISRRPAFHAASAIRGVGAL